MNPTAALPRRPLGRTGINVSPVSLGCWALGDGRWGEVDEANAQETLARAFDLGVNLFDTADNYGDGRSEELVGRAIKGRRHDATIVTKVGYWGHQHGALLSFAVPEHVYLCCDASLHRLGVDCIDVYLCHISAIEDPSVFLQAFDVLKQRGKIRFAGISTNRMDVVRQMDVAAGCDVVELEYNLLNRSAENDLLPYCKERGIGVIVKGPLAKGLLTGKFGPASQFQDAVRAHWSDGGAERARYHALLEQVERLRFLERPDRPLSHAALQFILANPAVSCAIPSAKTITQLEGNLAAAVGELGAIEVAKLADVAPGPT